MKSGKPDGKSKGNDGKDDVNDQVDALFWLPLAEFTGARNALAARLKKSGREEATAEAARVKALAKPSISAWAVNQLYWNHRETFDQLIASGERFHKAQTSRSGGKVADIRAALDARREALTQLSDLATSVLGDAGHNPAPDTIRRITTTLEGISAYASRSDAPRPGRLTADVDPPGFETFGSFPGTGREKQETGVGKQKTVVNKQEPGRGKRNDAARQEENRRAKIAAARVSLQEAKKSLTEARATAKSLETAEKRALADTKEAEKNRRDAEERFEKATTASKQAAQRARSVGAEVKEAASAVEEAERKVEEAVQELEKSFGR